MIERPMKDSLISYRFRSRLDIVAKAEVPSRNHSFWILPDSRSLSATSSCLRSGFSAYTRIRALFSVSHHLEQRSFSKSSTRAWKLELRGYLIQMVLTPIEDS